MVPSATGHSALLYSGQVCIKLSPRSHAYTVLDQGINNGNEFEVPSVTQILKVIDKSGPLSAWAVNSALAVAQRLISPGVAYTEEALSDILASAKSKYRRVSEEACEIGSLVHAWVEKYICAKLSGDAQTELPENEQAMSCCYAAVQWMDSHKLKPLSTETIVYSRKYGYAGTIDLLAEVDGKICVVDWKTSKAIYPEYHLQTAAYKFAIEEMGIGDQIGRWVVRIGKEDGLIEPLCQAPEMFCGDLEAFIAAKTLSLRIKEISPPGRAKW